MPMTDWDQRHFDLMIRLSQVYAPNNNDDETRRDFVRKLAQQFNYTFPEDGEWVCKRYQNGPQSSDVVKPKGASYGWDTMTGRQGEPAVIFQWNRISLDSNNIDIPVGTQNWLAPAHVDTPHYDAPTHADSPVHVDVPHDDAPEESAFEDILRKVVREELDRTSAQLQTKVDTLIVALKGIKCPIFNLRLPK